MANPMRYPGVQSTAPKRGDRKPANYGGFARKTPSEQKKPVVHLLLSKTCITPEEEMEVGIPGKGKKGRKKG